MEGVCFTAVRRGCGLYNLLSAVESIDILLSAVGACSSLMVHCPWWGFVCFLFENPGGYHFGLLNRSFII